MKNKKFLIAFLLTVLLLTACVPNGMEVTPAMTASMDAFADQYDVWYPDSEENIARVCAENPTDIFWNDELKGYAVLCPLPWYENSYGVVTLSEDETVLNAFGLGAASYADAVKMLASLGWDKTR